MSINSLFNQDLKVINIGLSSFKESLDKEGVESVHVDWTPPIGDTNNLLKQISLHLPKIEKANNKALQIILNGKPFLVGLDKAINVIPGMKKNMILHAGPPVTWSKMCGPMQGAVMGALLYEGIAKNQQEAKKIASSNSIIYDPCHQHSTVGPMAGIVSPSMPVFIIKNESYDNYAYCTMNEGLGKVLRYGAYSDDVIKKLKWMEQVLYPALQKAIKVIKKIDLKNIIAQALHMGDEVHNRNRAGTSLFFRLISSAVVKTSDPETASSVLEFIHGNDHFFLNLSMPACKATLDAARNIKNSSLAVVMSRNGTEFGVQLSGTKDQWFTGIAPVPDALFFPGYTKKDANPDIGDSSITETNGLGGFAIAASPAIVQFVGGSVSDAVKYTMDMYEITVGENNVYQIPNLNFRGTPTGIDVMKIAQKGILPFIDTGVAHRKPGIGQVGAGVLSAPQEPFIKALKGLMKKLKS